MVDYQSLLSEHLRVMHSVETLLPELKHATELVVHGLQSGGKILLFGNGGSAADAQHIAAEIVGRFESDRRGLPAIALTTDTSILTAVGNDYGYENIFLRQVQALAKPGDVLLAYSTSGNSPNILAATREAKDMGCILVALTGEGGGKLAAYADVSLSVESTSTARVQEAHAFLGHAICAAVDEAF